MQPTGKAAPQEQASRLHAADAWRKNTSRVTQQSSRRGVVGRSDSAKSDAGIRELMCRHGYRLMRLSLPCAVWQQERKQSIADLGDNMKASTLLAAALPLLGVFSSAPAFAQEPPCPFYENRSGLCGYYHSEISPAKAFVDTVVKRGNWSNPQHRPVILDVRSTPEYKAGHPDHAVNVPYPYIYQACDGTGRALDGACLKSISQIPQDPQFFVEYVKALIPNKDTPIYTLCRTGVRSVGAANLLTDAGYTNVRNIWEGFWGINLKAPKKQADGSVKEMSVDLNHDGVLDNRDLNGWRNHQDLPYDTRLLPQLIYKPMAYLYSIDD